VSYVDNTVEANLGHFNQIAWS